MLFQDLISQMYFNSFGPDAKSLCNGFLSYIINDNIFLFTFSQKPSSSSASLRSSGNWLI